jgi:hypothetical protein
MFMPWRAPAVRRGLMLSLAVTAVALVSALPRQVVADTVVLKNGDRVSGTLVRSSKQTV